MPCVWGRAARHEQAYHAFFLDQRLGVLLCELGVELVVQRDHFDLLTPHAAFGIDVVDVQCRALHGLGYRGCCRTGDAYALADEQLGVCGADPEGGQQSAERAGSANDLHGLSPAYGVPECRHGHRRGNCKNA